MDAPLLKTKLYIPGTRSGWVPRPLLLERLDEGLNSAKLTLLSAPAGFGKTTLLSEWVHSSERPVAWLTLDAGDNDPTRFWAYLLAALQTVHPHLGRDVQAALSIPPPEAQPVELWLASTINEIADLTERMVLVLDDLHLIESAQVHEGLFFLLDHLPPPAAGPPGGLHVVLSGRADPPWPLARLRTRGEMAELRARDLRFTADQAAAFLNDVAGLGLSAQEVAALETRTEGWIAGLQLAALALQGASTQGRRDRAAFVRAFSGSHHLVLDYLAQEVLDQQPPDVQSFMFQTSVLDRMSAPLCDALRESTGTASSQGSQAILERLERDNLFVVPLDDERRWYRYHRLFADLLRRRLHDAAPAHRAASAWFERQGWIVDAISHALAAGDHDRAAALIENQVPKVMARGDFGQMRPWIEALPETSIRASAQLSLARAWALYRSVAAETVEGWLRQAEALPVDPGTAAEVRGNAAFLRVLDARSRIAPLETQLSLLKQAERVIPESDRAMRCSVAAWLGLCYLDAEDEEAAERAFAQAWQIGRAGSGHWAAIVAVYGRTILARWHGDLQRAAALCREALTVIQAPGSGTVSSLAHRTDPHVLLGRVLLEWNDLVGAERSLAKGLDGGAPGLDEIVVKGQFARARLRSALGQVGEVPDLCRTAAKSTHKLTSYAAALEAWLCLISAARAPFDPRAAQWWQRATEWAASCPLEPDAGHWSTVERLVCARIRVAQYRAGEIHDLAPVLAFLGAQGTLLAARGWIELLIQTRIVQAMAWLALGREADALAALARALDLAAPGGYRRLFLDEGAPMERLLHRAAERGVASVTPILSHLSKGPPAQAPVDPLSQRELDVLRLLAAELSSTEIAERLVVSANTVRTHVQHIYQKLAVHSRYEAVVRARELGLL